MLRYKKRNLREGLRGRISRRHSFLREGIDIESKYGPVVQRAYEIAVGRLFPASGDFSWRTNRWLVNHEGVDEITPEIIDSYERLLREEISAQDVRYYMDTALEDTPFVRGVNLQDISPQEEEELMSYIEKEIENPKDLLGDGIFQDCLCIMLDIFPC